MQNRLVDLGFHEVLLRIVQILDQLTSFLRAASSQSGRGGAGGDDPSRKSVSTPVYDSGGLNNLPVVSAVADGGPVAPRETAGLPLPESERLTALCFTCLRLMAVSSTLSANPCLLFSLAARLVCGV